MTPPARVRVISVCWSEWILTGKTMFRMCSSICQQVWYQILKQLNMEGEGALSWEWMGGWGMVDFMNVDHSVMFPFIKKMGHSSVRRMHRRHVHQANCLLPVAQMEISCMKSVLLWSLHDRVSDLCARSHACVEGGESGKKKASARCPCLYIPLREIGYDCPSCAGNLHQAAKVPQSV